MYKNTKNYSEENKRNKKVLIGLILLLLSLILIISSTIAYFSDKASKSGNVVSGTLNINGSYQTFLNGQATELNDIKNLNPGDVILIKCTIANSGNKSAWVREKVELTSSDTDIFNYINVYNTEYAQENFDPEEPINENMLNLSGEGIAVSDTRVLNGSGENAETESDGEFNYIESHTYNFAITIYFMHTAPNSAQGKTISLSIVTQALQFRNNNQTLPNANAWDNVEEVL